MRTVASAAGAFNAFSSRALSRERRSTAASDAARFAAANASSARCATARASSRLICASALRRNALNWELTVSAVNPPGYSGKELPRSSFIFGAARRTARHKRNPAPRHLLGAARRGGDEGRGARSSRMRRRRRRTWTAASVSTSARRACACTAGDQAYARTTTTKNPANNAEARRCAPTSAR